MQDDALRLLDYTVAAVDEGFSYDGIVSVPEGGLEDIKHRFGQAGELLHDGVVGPLSNLLLSANKACTTGTGSDDGTEGSWVSHHASTRAWSHPRWR